MTQQWTKAELEEWCLGWCRTPHTTLRAFIDAGFCSDEEPRREETRLRHQPTAASSGSKEYEEAFYNERAASEALREALVEAIDLAEQLHESHDYLGTGSDSRQANKEWAEVEQAILCLRVRLNRSNKEGNIT